MATQKKTKQKKQKTRRTYTVTKQGVLRALSFCGIVFAAIVFTVNAILSWCINIPALTGTLNLLAQICLLIAVAIPAYDFVKSKDMVWKVIFAIALIIYIFGCVFGVIHIYIG